METTPVHPETGTQRQRGGPGRPKPPKGGAAGQQRGSGRPGRRQGSAPDGAKRPAASPAATTWRLLQPWIGTVARAVVGVVFFVAGALKVSDLAASGRAVNAYDVMPVGLGRFVGAMLPLVEMALGVLLLVGIATRILGIVSAGLFVVFITGVSQAWARGLTIDCGCFGGGGQVAANQTKYAWEISRDILLLALAAFIVVFPRTRYSLDARLAGPKENE